MKAVGRYEYSGGASYMSEIDADRAPETVIGPWRIDNNVPLLHADHDVRHVAEHLGLVWP